MTSFYKNRKIVVTGGASFIGSHLVERLVNLGSQVTVIDDLSSGKIINLENIVSKIKFVEGDLRFQEVANNYFSGQDFVFHLANIHGGRGFIETHPGEIAQNFLIDGNVFWAAKNNGIKKVCYTSSACAYPTELQKNNPIPEHRFLKEDMADPFSPGKANADGVYGWAKFMGELALKSYHEQFGLEGVSCRLFTVYGPRENESHAIIAFIAKALLKMDPYVIWGSGNQDRNFTYIEDIVDGLILAMEKISDCSAINIGTNEITTIKFAAQTVCEYLKFKPKEFLFDTSKPEGVISRAASTEMQLRKLGWQPKIKFSEGIAKTIEWYKSKVDLEDLRIDFETKLMDR